MPVHTFYPPSENPYSDPLSKASQGTAHIDQSKIDLSDSELEQAKNDVKNGKISYAIFGYVGTSNKLKVEYTSGEDSGSANLDEIVEDLNNGKQLFGFLRVYLQNNTVPKYVYFSWNPAGVPPLLKGLMHGRSYDVGNWLGPFHLSVDAQNENDLKHDKMLDKLHKSSNI